ILEDRPTLRVGVLLAFIVLIFDRRGILLVGRISGIHSTTHNHDVTSPDAGFVDLNSATSSAPAASRFSPFKLARYSSTKFGTIQLSIQLRTAGSKSSPAGAGCRLLTLAKFLVFLFTYSASSLSSLPL